MGYKRGSFFGCKIYRDLLTHLKKIINFYKDEFWKRNLMPLKINCPQCQSLKLDVNETCEVCGYLCSVQRVILKLGHLIGIEALQWKKLKN